ncbi:hypothetical protein ROA7450_02914 [Roseovarius albus]|uniref:DUF58 domain-containing protein n=1 Tax=Roseovarius albus TaxID=1247867 RepID=A0A1X6ZN87_9RHOB|nr:DUF58 domain-containing protein [Roseovarius albus]SLN56292.1 hypothetical protein ROA7450_02914 [Roseovarius albus]
MRPSRRLLILVLALAALTFGLGLSVENRALWVAVIWGAMVLACLVDLLLSHSARNFSVSVDMVSSGFAGRKAMLDLNIGSTKGRLPPLLTLRLSHGPLLAPQPETSEAISETKQREVKLHWPIDLLKRGQGAVTQLSACYASRLGLFEVLPRWPLNLPVDIVPDISPVTSGEIMTQMLPLLDGMKDMSVRGQGSEFHQLREFQAGMDPRSIDWKRSARLREMVARETRAERNHQIIIAVDSGHLMAERVGKLSKLDTAINAALALTWAGGLGGDNVGFYSFDAKPGQFLPPRPGRRAFGQIQAHSAALEQSSVETNHTLGLTQMNQKLSQRSLVVVFSDFVDTVTAELLIENLAVIRRQHLVLYVALRDPALKRLSQPEQAGMNAVAQAVSAQQLLRERDEVIDRLRRLGILCLDTEVAGVTPALISRYMDIKAQGMI